MADGEDKKNIVLEKANKIAELTKSEGWQVLQELIEQSWNQYQLAEATDWADFRFRLGVRKGLQLLEEITGVVIATGDRIRRGKKNF